MTKKKRKWFKWKPLMIKENNEFRNKTDMSDFKI